MSGCPEYDDPLDFPEEGQHPAQLTARRTRRRRRHGKKQGLSASDASFDAQSEDSRGRWLPPPSATSLTLAQLGIHMPARKECQDASLTLAQLGIRISAPVMPNKASPDAPSRNVVTWSDLDLVNSVGKTLPTGSPGACNVPAQSPQHQPSPCMPTAAPTWQFVEERPWERILSVPSPQVALSLPDNSVINHFPAVGSHSHPSQHMQPPVQQIPMHDATWRQEPDAAMRHWLCSGHYGAQPIYHHTLCDSSTMQLAAAQPPPMSTAPMAAMAIAPGHSGLVPPPPLAAAPGCEGLPLEMQSSTECTTLEAESESSKLDTLLEHLAADAYQD